MTGVPLGALTINYFSLGTLDGQSGVVFGSKPDDFLLIGPGRAALFVFSVAGGEILQSNGGEPNNNELEVADGVFVEIKRLVRENLGGKKVSPTIESAESGVIRKAEAAASKVEGAPLNAGAAPAVAPAAPAPATPTASTNAPSAPAPAPAPAATPTPPPAPAD